MPSVLRRCWFGVRKGIRPVKIWVMRCWHGYLLERVANSLHMVQLMPLSPHHLCFSRIQNGLSFWYRLTWIVPNKGSYSGCSVVVVIKTRPRRICWLWLSGNTGTVSEKTGHWVQFSGHRWQFSSEKFWERVSSHGTGIAWCTGRRCRAGILPDHWHLSSFSVSLWFYALLLVELVL